MLRLLGFAGHISDNNCLFDARLDCGPARTHTGSSRFGGNHQAIVAWPVSFARLGSLRLVNQTGRHGAEVPAPQPLLARVLESSRVPVKHACVAAVAAAFARLGGRCDAARRSTCRASPRRSIASATSMLAPNHHAIATAIRCSIAILPSLSTWPSRLLK